MKIVCDDKIPFLKGVFEPYAEVSYISGAEISPEDVRVADALIIRTRTRADAGLLDGSRVRIVATATIGFDHIDTQYCDSHGIMWTNAPGCNASSVCQWVASTLEYLTHKHGLKMYKLRLGIVGVGNVGGRVSDWASGRFAECLLCDPPRAASEKLGDYVSLDEIIGRSDIITLHVPLDKTTYHMFGAARLSQMRSGQLLVNCSRGEVVDNMALEENLGRKAILGAALDVWENEPRISLPLMDKLDVATPHIAGYSADGKAAGTGMAVRSVAETLGISALMHWEVPSIPEAVIPEYDVLRDDAALRAHPEQFESLRSNYPVRREPLYRKY